MLFARSSNRSPSTYWAVALLWYPKKHYLFYLTAPSRPEVNIITAYLFFFYRQPFRTKNDWSLFKTKKTQCLSPLSLVIKIKEKEQLNIRIDHSRNEDKNAKYNRHFSSNQKSSLWKKRIIQHAFSLPHHVSIFVISLISSIFNIKYPQALTISKRYFVWNSY
jgi:hypothetical protein